MTDPLDAVPQSDDRPAFTPAPLPLAVRRPSRSGRLFRWWLLTSLVLVIALVGCITFGLGHLDITPLHIVIDGDDITRGITIDGVDTGMQVLVAAAAVMLALLLLLLVPMLLLLVFCVVVVAIVAGVGVPLAAVALALAVVTSPLWLVAFGLWFVLRRRPAAPVTIHA